LYWVLSELFSSGAEMNLIHLKEPIEVDEELFLSMTNQSKRIHEPWTKSPLTHDEFDLFIEKSRQEDHKSYCVYADEKLFGVFNISGIIRGYFQSAYLGFYVFEQYSGKGLMSQGLKLVLNKVFTELALHRIEANIQPNNYPSIRLVQRNGFKKEGFSPKYLKINDQWCDHERWAITIEDWEAIYEKH
jgi:RimJ/RimL family protein N-acetyltransferase